MSRAITKTKTAGPDAPANQFELSNRVHQLKVIMAMSDEEAIAARHQIAGIVVAFQALYARCPVLIIHFQKQCEFTSAEYAHYLELGTKI